MLDIFQEEWKVGKHKLDMAVTCKAHYIPSGMVLVCFNPISGHRIRTTVFPSEETVGIRSHRKMKQAYLTAPDSWRSIHLPTGAQHEIARQ